MATGTDIWDLRGCTAAQQAIILRALDRSNFDFNLLKPGLAAGNQWSAPGRTTIPVTFRDLSGVNLHKGETRIDEDHDHSHGYHVLRSNAEAPWGLFWFDGRVEIDTSLERDPETAGMVFFAEGAHATDMYYMLPKNMRPAVFALLHGGSNVPDGHGWFEGPYFTQVGEAVMGLYVRAYTDYRWTINSFTHPPTDEAVAAFKNVLAPIVEPPAPPPPPPPPPPPALAQIDVLVPPVDVPVGTNMVCQFVGRDQHGTVMHGLGTATVTPLGAREYLSAPVRPAENGVYTYSIVPTLPHPASENFRLRVSLGGLTVETAPFVVHPKETAPPPPPPPPPNVYITAMRTEFTAPDRGTLTVYYSDGSFKAVAF